MSGRLTVPAAARAASRSAWATLRGSWSRDWIAWCAVALFLASDTKVVLKDRISGAGTSVDPFILAEVAVYGVVGLVVLRRGRLRPQHGQVHPLEVLMLALVVTMVLSTMFSIVPVYSAVRAGQALVLFLLARAAIGTGSVHWFRTFAVLTLGVTAVLVVVGLVLPSQRGPLQLDRFNWLATHPVVVGQFTALSTGIGVALTLMTLRSANLAGPRPAMVRKALALALGTLVCSAGLFATHTRASVVAALGGVAVALALTVPQRQRSSLALAAGWGGLMFLLVAGAWAVRWFDRGGGADSLVSLNSRTDLWALAVGTTLRESPALGLGLGASRSAFYSETGLGGGHNALVNVVADLGLLGLLIWLPLIAWSALVVWRSGPPSLGAGDRTVWLVAFTVLVVNGITYEGMGSPPTMAFTWTLMLVVVAIHAERIGPSAPGQNALGATASPHPARGVTE